MSTRARARVCVRVWVRFCEHARAHAFVCARVPAWARARGRACVCACVGVCARAVLCISKHMFVCVCMGAWVYNLVCGWALVFAAVGMRVSLTSPWAKPGRELHSPITELIVCTA